MSQTAYSISSKFTISSNVQSSWGTGMVREDFGKEGDLMSPLVTRSIGPTVYQTTPKSLWINPIKVHFQCWSIGKLLHAVLTETKSPSI